MSTYDDETAAARADAEYDALADERAIGALRERERIVAWLRGIAAKGGPRDRLRMLESICTLIERGEHGGTPR